MIGANRRSSAGSLPTCRRYSSTVVAPINRTSPRANAGLSIVPASIDPSPAPAPTMLCTSSMNTSKSSRCARISASTSRNRCSNSPRYFAPATIPARSNDTTRTSANDHGTAPATIRRANPSTIAVLPTPGSPTNTGLFFDRRPSTSMACSISASRPTTGSNFPARANSVRSSPNSSSRGVTLNTDRAPPRSPNSIALANARPVTESASAANPNTRCRAPTTSAPSPNAC